jgi:protein-disulfide isomerase
VVKKEAMHKRLPLLVALVGALGPFACGPAPEPVIPPPAPSASVSVAAPVPPPPATSAPVVKAPEVKPPPAEPSDLASEADMNDAAAHLRVPVGSSPVDGKATALVTLVMFGGFQDPFSFRAMNTIHDLQKKYGDDLRLVWKDRPLAFHKMSVPMLLAARDARETRGDAAFWQATGIIFQQHEKIAQENKMASELARAQGQKGKPSPQKPLRVMDERAFKEVARQLKISAAKQKDLLAAKFNPPVIADDEALATELRVEGTPTFFINGRRLVGAQPPDRFSQVIEEELVVAKEQEASGTERSKIYETLQKKALRPKPREKVTPIPASTGAGMGPPSP